ncbi:uncharacterized protein BCR38DRAFT_488578 [Pseudomassariella vexata]|uniref:Zn(2)-C6 fungal-type domain-containing protein n=1 Tax=Pseudomassariella vexata TaxID=1141098 RepID=A0A1Y2DJX2_9PEZI|nr:uncharacterized protein BCR38DRAFT_488578 [Pseudomassariella vexata]ORY59548.1 hypothetical protein BCR38DRAFT_488578 [Pseudomassariella vexata]
MMRRSHRKSRKGCFECKRRHIRCDEQHPQCIACLRADRVCTYPDTQTGVQPTTPVPALASVPSSTGSNSPAVDTAVGTPTSSITSPQTHFTQPVDLFADNGDLIHSDGNCSINFSHLELFNHFTNHYHLLFGDEDNDMPRCQVQVTIKAAFQTPYLMYEILAFSARQLSVEAGPEKCQFYSDQATKLQSRAINMFNSVAPVPDGPNCVGMFLFSTLIGMHLMSDTIAFRDSELDPFLTRFLNYLRLHRGVRAISSNCYNLLIQSELEPVLAWGVKMAGEKGEGHECDAVRQLISEASDLSEDDINASHGAIEHLQFVFDGSGPQQQLGRRVHMAFSWPLLISEAFTELLYQRRPVALIILAYYAAMLHYCRDLWMVGSAGRHIVRLITKFLGSQWTPWLAWPNKVVNDDS